MENFYQESGRAGRDGHRARCLAFFRFADVFRLSSMVFSERTGLEKIYGMLAYCVNYNRCRRSLIADHFGEVWQTKDCSKMCDICVKEKDSKELDSVNAKEKDSFNRLNNVPALARVALSAVRLAAAKDAKLTPLKVVNALLGKGEAKFRVRKII